MESKEHTCERETAPGDKCVVKSLTGWQLLAARGGRSRRSRSVVRAADAQCNETFVSKSTNNGVDCATAGKTASRAVPGAALATEDIPRLFLLISRGCPAGSCLRRPTNFRYL